MRKTPTAAALSPNHPLIESAHRARKIGHVMKPEDLVEARARAFIQTNEGLDVFLQRIQPAEGRELATKNMINCYLAGWRDALKWADDEDEDQ